ncbi:group II intron maturase-specific domain-containing protein [Nocardioides immobilis]|uniref:group II intron maturase-specific domain-containing protein n=1 Tax=Nocardioides immobilis TaxID=2049295 RepID=UPI001C70F851
MARRGRLRLPPVPSPAGAQPRTCRAKGVIFLARWPSKKAVQHARDRVREITARRRQLRRTDWIVEDLNRFLRGWSAYFRNANSATQFCKINRYTQLATEPNKTAGRGPQLWTSTRQLPPSATAVATWSTTFPGSWTARSDRHGDNARDRPRSRPRP